jgi:O-antigen/teichoic acid export membrane protein
VITKIKIFFSGDIRNVRLKKNIIGSVVIKGCSIFISFLLVPMTLGYLNAYEYGIWLTLSSILLWINSFDIGLGNGLRNKLAEALALNDKHLAKIYVSTTFFLLSVLIVLIYTFFLILHYFLDWYRILNVSIDVIHDLNSLISIVFFLFCVSFIFKVIGSIYLACQLSVINDLLNLLGNVLSLVIIFILTKMTQGDLAKVAITYSVSPVFVYIIAYFFTFYIIFPYLKPSFSAIKIKYSKVLMGLGIKFFVNQIASLVVFSTSNVLILRLFGSEEVTSYNIAYKYFSVIPLIFNIIISPTWSAITEAYVKGDYHWINRIIKRMQYIWLGLLFFTIFMIFFSNIAYSFWVGTEIKISILLSTMMAIFVSMMNWVNIFGHFINGVGKIKLQYYYSIVSSILYIPLAIILCRNFGIIGISIAMCFNFLPSMVLWPIQYKKIIAGKDSGIWGK